MIYVGLTAVSLLALYGVTQLVGLVAERWWRPPKNTRAVVVLPLSGHVEDVEYRVRCLERQCRWGKADIRLVVVDDGMDEETCLLARELCARLSGVSFYEKGQWNLQEKAFQSDEKGV